MNHKQKVRKAIKVYSKDYFKYKNGHWRNQVTLHKLDPFVVARNLATVATRAFNRAVKDVVENDENYLRIAGALLAIDKQAVSFARVSDGVDEGFRLSDYWCRSILVHHTIDDASRDGMETEAISNLRGIFEMLEWDFDEAYDTKSDDIRTTQEVHFSYIPEDKILGGETDEELEKFCIEGSLKLVLEPTREFPLGSEYKDGKGNVWKVDYFTEKSIMCYPTITPHKNGTFSVIPFHENQLRNMHRVM